MAKVIICKFCAHNVTPTVGAASHARYAGEVTVPCDGYIQQSFGDSALIRQVEVTKPLTGYPVKTFVMRNFVRVVPKAHRHVIYETLDLVNGPEWCECFTPNDKCVERPRMD